ncbi:EI24 domain-containing protein [Ramlibacter sp. MMS24-I3-19]|uniref:EI24 domain-containing protein n=1 Tax=Ramlibacter sp. MMS24-I3-19 TaxID=3416606 RepID=UPI003D0075EC
MGLLLDSFWRAVAYCLHPRVVALSVLPLILMVAAALGLGWLFWAPAVDGVFRWLESSAMLSQVGEWLQGMGLGNLRTVIAPLLVIAIATPVIVLVALLAVAVLMTPAIVKLVAERRFPQLERRRGGSMLASIGWSLGSTLLALVALVLSLPLWLIPPLVLVLPPLIWGWLTYRVMTFDALAEHASADERRAILRRHRLPLLAIGIVSGYLGAAPSVLWASGALFAAAFVLLVPLAIWIYTLVFAFSSLWFGHYCLAALAQLRAPQEPAAPSGGAVAAPVALPDVHQT